MIRRINIFCGPGGGKSTSTARIFAELKERHFSIEQCTEYVKRWVYLKRNVLKYDQIYLFAKQQQMEYSCLSNGIDLIITDSPCFLSYFYTSLYFPDDRLVGGIKSLLDSYEDEFPSLNIFLHRNNKPYKTEGRYQSENEAKEIDIKMLKSLKDYYGNIIEVNYQDKEYLLELILDTINEKNNKGS